MKKSRVLAVVMAVLMNAASIDGICHCSSIWNS